MFIAAGRFHLIGKRSSWADSRCALFPRGNRLDRNRTLRGIIAQVGPTIGDFIALLQVLFSSSGASRLMRL